MNLDADVEVLKGVGEKMAEVLHKFGIRTVKDFFYNLTVLRTKELYCGINMFRARVREVQCVMETKGRVR